MARYRKIDVRIWGDEKFQSLSGLEPSGKALWLYLLTSPNTNSIPGLFRCGEAAMAEELGWPLKAFREAFAEVFRQGLAEADWKARLVWIPKAQKYNRPESPNVVASWAVSWDELPECRLKAIAYASLRDFTEGLGEGFRKAFDKACPKPSGKALPNQEQEQEQEHRTEADLFAEDDIHEDSPESSTESSGKMTTPPKEEKKLSPQQAFIEAAWGAYDEVGATRPAAALLAKWARDYFKGNYGWMLRCLAEMSPKGYLSRGEAYVGTALKNIAEGKSFTPPAKQSVDREWLPVGTLDGKR